MIFIFIKVLQKKLVAIYYPVEKFYSKFIDVLIKINHEDYAIAKKK